MSEENKPGGFATNRQAISAARELVKGGIRLGDASVLTLLFDAEAMLATIDALKADNAALTQSILDYHESWKAGRDTLTQVAMLRLAKPPSPGAALLERLKRLEDFVSLFADIAESAIDHHEWKAAGSKGMQVPFHGEFAHAPTSVISDLRRLAKQAREALKP